MHESKKHPKDEHLEFFQECCEVGRALPHRNWARGYAILCRLKKAYEDMDYSEYLAMGESPPERPPLKRIS